MSERPHVSAQETIELLRSVWGWVRVEESLLRRAAAGVELVSLPAGAWLFRAGEEATAAYAIASGRLEVVIEEPEETVVRVLRRGSAVGELALLRGGVRSASIRAQRDSTLIALNRRQFEELLRDSPTFALSLTRALGEQLANTLSPATTMPRPRAVSILALDPGVDAAAACDSLVSRLSSFGTASFLSAAPGENAREWAGRLARAEAHQDRVVLLAGTAGPDDPWSAFCLAEADLIVALTTGNPDNAWLDHGAQLAGCELVSVDARLRDVWIDRLRPRMVRSVRGAEGLAGAMRDLAKRVSGRAVGIVLSGGGARALAHIGVIEELRRSGVAFDRVAGVSMGSLVAALVARGDADERIYAEFRRCFVEQSPSNDYTIPVVALTRGRKTARLIDETVGSVRIEELQMPFYCTSTDLLRRQLVVHRDGPLARALLASVALPGVFPPVLDRHRRLLVDGGVIDNLPVRTMAEDDGGPVIAVDVTTAGEERAVVPHPGPTASAASGLRRRITGSEDALPRLGETILRCMTLASADTAALARRHADLVITPDLSGIALLDWHRLPEAHAAGVRAARTAIQQSPEFFEQIFGNQKRDCLNGSHAVHLSGGPPGQRQEK
jgi:NTE family protein